MADSDLDCLREFGEKVQSTSAKKDGVKKKNVFTLDVNYVKEGIIHLSTIFLRLCNQLMHKLNHLFFCSIKQVCTEKKKIMSLNWSNSKYKLNNDSFDDSSESHVLVESQKQLGNTSIIIRRRKIKRIDHSEKSLMPSFPSKSVAYYFHRIDTQEKESKTNFSPRSSLWDFTYHSQDSFFLHLKKIFFKK
ncbi:MAG TPA: hypothetical protein VKP59_01165 [Candidatus Thermoplasmatota archaeon]|nr:hypothetical protein [Candidatus Thermoplasmatota archaeon]